MALNPVTGVAIDIQQGLEPVMEPYAQTKVGHHFLETKSDHLVLPETAYITVKLMNALQTHLQKEVKNRIVQKAGFFLAILLFYQSLRTAIQCAFVKRDQNLSKTRG